MNGGQKNQKKRVINISKLIDLTGQRFGALTVLNRAEDYVFKSGRKERMWSCKCDCGNIVTVFGSNLKKKNTTSCGCIKKEYMKKEKTKHGLTDSRLYYIYSHMKSRCCNKNNKNFENYGGRGIQVCEEWLGENGFLNFYEWAMNNGYSEHLTIDRIDVNGNYEPSNCRWADLVTQENNRTNNRMITYDGQTMTMAMWAKKLGINYKTLANRIYTNKWSIEKALTTPVRKINKLKKSKNESEEL